MYRRGAINEIIYVAPNKKNYMEHTFLSYNRQRNKYINYGKETAKLYLDLFYQIKQS